MTVVGSLRFARYELGLFLRTWYGSAFSVFLAPLLYLAGIGLGVGALVADGGTSPQLGGLSYAAFAGTGLLAATSMQNGAGAMTWPVMGAISYTRTWHAVTSTPLRPGDIVGGSVVVLGLRLLVASAVFALALLGFGLIDLGGAAAVIPVAVLTGVACGTPMFAFAAWVPEALYLSFVFRFVVVPLFILSGTFFPLSSLPAAVQPVAALSPLWHGVELVRHVGLGMSTTLHPLLHLTLLLAVLGAGMALAVRALSRKLQP